MSTYENCYEMLGDVRRGINEYSSTLHNGTDTTNAHSNSYLVKKINAAQRYLYALLFQRIPEEFLEETSLTGVDSVYTLPWDFGRLVYFKDENGQQVYPIKIRNLRLTEETGSDRFYYKKGNTLVLDKDGVTETYTLFYYRKPRDLEQGKASDGGSTTMTLSSNAKLIADYYNGMTVENITQDWIDTVDDYTAARVATISETAASDDYYGFVPEIPEPFHFLIAPKATHLVKSGSAVVQEKPSKQDLDEWNRMFVETLKSFCGSDDTNIEDVFCDYDQNYYSSLVW